MSYHIAPSSPPSSQGINLVQGESTKEAFRRLQQALHFSFDKSSLEKQINRLRKGNTDLMALRSQLGQMDQRISQPSGSLAHKSIPRHFSEVQQISSEAYSALTTSFSCTDTSHDQHSAAVCLDAEVVEEIRLDMAIVYMRQHSG
jgi:hypothetical protein